MSIFAKYTLASLRKNKTRTIVTVVGIVLSVAMFTAVTEAVASLRAFLVDSIVYSEGAYHAHTGFLDETQISELSADKRVARTESLTAIGYADAGSENPYKPYLFVAGMSDGFSDLCSVHIQSGRMPEKDGEILIPDHLATNGGVLHKLGDTLTLSLGSRPDGATQSDPFEEGEALTPRETRTYTVVGFYDRFSLNVEPYEAPGYTALTVESGSGPAEAFFTLKNVRGVFDAQSALKAQYGEITVNRDLMMVLGVSRYNSINRVIFGFAAVLIALIMFGSVSLIYNSFSISLSERVKQFGILKSVGATRRQIRGTVFYEALFLCVIGIPLGLLSGCAGLGITLFALRGNFSTLIGVTAFSGVKLGLSLSPAALIAAAVIGALTTFISAWIPARRAVKIPAIEAVQQTRDVKPKNVRLHTGRLTYKLFGFEGLIAAKNFKRAKRRYRAAILSLFMSVVLFVSASSFCRYLTDASGSANALTEGFDIRYSASSNEVADNERVFEALCEADGVTDAALVYYDVPQAVFERSALTDKAKEIASDPSSERYSMLSPEICYVDEQTYKSLTNKKYDPEHPAAVLVNDFTVLIREGDGKIENATFFKKTDSITAYRFDSTEYWVEQEGDKFYAHPHDGTERYEISVEKDAKRQEIAVSGTVDGVPYYLLTTPALVYPMSAYDEESGFYTNMLFKTSDHRAAAESMKKILNELGEPGNNIYDAAEGNESVRAIVTIINVFAYGFIILISLIALTNVFNSVSTNIYLRRRELAMYRSIGMTKGGFNRMMNYECIICGARGLLWGIPASVLVTLAIYTIVMDGVTTDFYMPWYSIAIAVLSVFVVVFGAMIYTMRRIRKENTIDILRNENV